MKEVKLSIIVPVHNNEKYIGRCMDSILCQNISSMEIIVIDDCSTDNSINIVNTYKAKYDIIIVLKTDRQSGPGHTRNIGLQNAKGEYVGFVDSDDWIDIDMYRVLIENIEMHKSNIAICGMKTEYGSTFSSAYRYIYRYANKINNNQALRMLSKSIDTGAAISPILGNKIFRNDFIQNLNLRFPINSYNEDDYFTFIALLHTPDIVVVPSVFYHYYQRCDSITHYFDKKYIDSLFCTFMQIRNHMEDNNMYNCYESEYFAFMEKCLTFILAIMFNKEQNDISQKAVIQYTIESFLKQHTLQELIKHMDTMRIKQYLGLV